MTDPSSKDNAVINVIVNIITSRCGCVFSSDLITNRVFQCFPSSPHSVFYHAQIHSTPDTSADNLVANLREWASSGASISVNSQHLSVESFCLTLTSIPMEKCPDDVLLITSLSVSTAVSSESTPIPYALVGMIVGATSVIVILLVIFMTSIVIVVQKCRHLDDTCNTDSR